MQPIITFTPEFIALVIGMSYVWAAAYLPWLITTPLKLVFNLADLVVTSFISVFTVKKTAPVRARKTH